MRLQTGRTEATQDLALSAIAVLRSSRGDVSPGSSLVAALRRRDVSVGDHLEHLRRAHGSFAALIDGPVSDALTRIGMLWDDDAIPFAEAVRATACLNAAILSDIETLAPSGDGQAGAILLATLPQDTHGLSATLAGFAFREAGYDVVTRMALPAERIAAEAARLGVDAVGLCVGDRRCGPELARAVAGLRSVPRGPFVMIGGPAAAETSAEHALEPDVLGGSLRATLARLDERLRAM